MKIKIYDGMPDSLRVKIKKVDDKYRTNPLSIKPGGTDVVVEYLDFVALQYDKIKIPSRYIEEIVRVTKHSVEEIVRVYSRPYFDDKDREIVPFILIWDKDSGYALDQQLKKFDPIDYLYGKAYSYRVKYNTLEDNLFIATNAEKGERFFTKGEFEYLLNRNEIKITSNEVFILTKRFSLFEYVKSLGLST